MNEGSRSEGGDNAGSAAERSFSPFQVLIRLQYLRSQICGWVRGPGSDLTGNDTEEILFTLQGLAATARTTGVDAYAAICLHLAELIEPLVRVGGMPGAIRRALTGWADHSDRYLRHPRDPSHAVQLIEQLNHPEWASPFSRDEQSVLFRALRAPFARCFATPVNTSPDGG
jgi:hypothetical protein